MPEYFETRERALLGARYEELYRPATETAARGVTVNALRCTPGEFAVGAGIELSPSPFCDRAFLAPADFRPGRWPGCAGRRSTPPPPKTAGVPSAWTAILWAAAKSAADASKTTTPRPCECWVDPCAECPLNDGI